MPVINRIAEFSEDMKTWRRHLHTMPELELECYETASYVVERLKEFGITEIHEGIAKSGVVAIIEGQGEGPTIGLRADMDALPMTEMTGLEYASKVDGRMHACGHDGHTTMLLGAAKYMAETRNFSGRVALIFQPAEEEGGGGEVMVQEGMMEKFGIDQVYALHNAPGTPIGHFYTTPGPIMAAVDTFTMNIMGKGGHGAYPHDCNDPIPVAISIAQAIQTIVSRNHDGRKEIVISVTQIHSGTASNIIPESAMINGTVRTFDPEVQKLVMDRMQAIADGQAAAFGVEVELDYEIGYPATINDPNKAAFAAEVAKEVAGEAGVSIDVGPEMGAEDFSYMLNERPGAYLFVGNGDSAGVHHPEYDFADETAASGASFFARIVERAQPVVR
ncbi:hippurate hydrolase [Cognatiyoonia sediminum]|uniref:Hippurate hydrolase n=1 Tax=Cognatiyoonia sediminum TaxID=1508389 RepID=A0A1M5LWN0_9RHOB|nr:M20 aminoacylase family protein [Cognatiyoonia sediminum]SHG69504.1 hippurate hydrolase [Cognatiyoonia sediminum]